MNTLKPRGGRADARFELCMSPEDRQEIAQLALAANQSMAGFIRQRALGRDPGYGHVGPGQSPLYEVQRNRRRTT